MPHLSALFIYPVKSLRGVAVDAAELDALGLVGDRRFLVVDEADRFLTQRVLPQMARIATALTAEYLVLRSEGTGEIAIPRASDPAATVRSITIWKSEGLLAEDCGDDVARWLSDALQHRCRLVRIGGKFARPILKPEVAGPGERVHFADAYPLLVIGEATLADLNDRLVAQSAEPVPMDRFRSNLVIAESAAFAEDTWPRFRIGEVTFRAAGPCARCSVPTVDQLTGERTGPEPLRTLATYRRGASDPTKINFGQNLIHETKSGTLRVGDAVVRLS